MAASPGAIAPTLKPTAPEVVEYSVAGRPKYPLDAAGRGTIEFGPTLSSREDAAAMLRLAHRQRPGIDWHVFGIDVDGRRHPLSYLTAREDTPRASAASWGGWLLTWYFAWLAPLLAMGAALVYIDGSSAGNTLLALALFAAAVGCGFVIARTWQRVAAAAARPTPAGPLTPFDIEADDRRRAARC